jgi:two-component system, OmpR family, phosphate regulon response regulator PhoB
LSATVVLVASPDEGLRAQVRLTLGDERFEVLEATDTDDAVRAVAETVPALVVLDQQLPGALMLARSLRSEAATADARTLLLVPRRAAQPDDGSGIDATMSVPMTSFALLHRVDELLEDPLGR